MPSSSPGASFSGSTVVTLPLLAARGGVEAVWSGVIVRLPPPAAVPVPDPERTLVEVGVPVLAPVPVATGLSVPVLVPALLPFAVVVEGAVLAVRRAVAGVSTCVVALSGVAVVAPPNAAIVCVTYAFNVSAAARQSVRAVLRPGMVPSPNRRKSVFFEFGWHFVVPGPGAPRLASPSAVGVHMHGSSLPACANSWQHFIDCSLGGHVFDASIAKLSSFFSVLCCHDMAYVNSPNFWHVYLRRERSRSSQQHGEKEEATPKRNRNEERDHSGKDRVR